MMKTLQTLYLYIYSFALRLGTACGSATAFSLGLATKEKIDELMKEI